MSHALATVLHRGRKAASIVIAACLANRRRQRSELRPHPKEEAMSYALATVLHRGRRPRVASREARWETAHVHRRCLAPTLSMSSNRRRQRSELRPHPKEEAVSHALATVLHRGRKAASNVNVACLASSREAR